MKYTGWPESRLGMGLIGGLLAWYDTTLLVNVAHRPSHIGHTVVGGGRPSHIGHTIGLGGDRGSSRATMCLGQAGIAHTVEVGGLAGRVLGHRGGCIGHTIGFRGMGWGAATLGIP